MIEGVNGSRASVPVARVLVAHGADLRARGAAGFDLCVSWQRESDIRVSRLLDDAVNSSLEVLMRFKIVLRHDEEGYSVSAPGLPGCWSQGATEAEAIENMADAIREYIAARDDLLDGTEVREIEIAV